MGEKAQHSTLCIGTLFVAAVFSLENAYFTFYQQLPKVGGVKRNKSELNEIVRFHWMFFFSISHDKNFGGLDANLKKNVLVVWYLMMHSFLVFSRLMILMIMTSKFRKGPIWSNCNYFSPYLWPFFTRKLANLFIATFFWQCMSAYLRKEPPKGKYKRRSKLVYHGTVDPRNWIDFEKRVI